MSKKDENDTYLTKRLESAAAESERIECLSSRFATIRSHIPNSLLIEEPQLQGSVWVEHRYKNPLERTQEFAREYFFAYQRNFSLVGDEADSFKKRPIDPILTQNSADVVNALWRARQEADRSGLPYDLYLDRLMWTHVKNDKAKRLPRPNQLYGKLALPRVRNLMDTATLTERLCGPSWDSRFRAENFGGDTAQLEALGMIRDVVSNAEHPQATLALFLCERRAVSLEQSVEIFGKPLTFAALHAGKGVPHEGKTMDCRSATPACFGFLASPTTEVCGFCPVQDMCGRMASRVSEKLVQETGSADPIAQRVREQGKVRQQRLRDKRKRHGMAEKLK